ncbi:hypothetical protein [Corynebacterium sputi]|uniref:hypothetical protein n=1 Tax=Corynebacterium sputi TaxID=489915 RepID=UPI00047D209F|nr:hypothetical protein [Corynebacterium sputi]
MEFLFSTPGYIPILAVFIGGAILWGKMMDSVSAKANQHVFQRGKHQRGQEQMDTNVGFSTASASAETVRDMIVRSIPLEAHGVMKRTYTVDIQQAESGGWDSVYTYGNKVAQNFRTMVYVGHGDGWTGCQGFIGVIEALSADGVLTHPDEMIRWRHAVVDAIRRVDASAQFTELVS